jgi:integrase
MAKFGRIEQIKEYRKKNGDVNYQFQIKHNGKVIRRRGFPNYPMAETAYFNLKEELRSKRYSQSSHDISYYEAYQMWIKHYTNEVADSTFLKTTKMFEHHIFPFIHDQKLNDITPEMCQDAINDWATKLVDYRTTINYAAKPFDEAIRFKYIKDNPFNYINVPKKTQHVKKVEQQRLAKKNYWEENELLQFLETVKKYGTTQQYTLFYLLSYTGLRRQEVLALQWQDIDFNKNKLFVRRAISKDRKNRDKISTTKTTGSYRMIGLDDDTINELKNWQEEQQQILEMDILPKDQWIFSNSKNQPFAVTRPYSWLVKFQKMAHVRPITLHGLRHTHATLLMANNPNISPKDIEARLGHTDIETTLNIYTHVTDDSDDKIVTALNNFKHKEKNKPIQIKDAKNEG